MAKRKKKDSGSDNGPDNEGSFSGSTDSGELLRRQGIYYITDEIDTNSLLEIHQDILLKHLDLRWQDDIQVIVNSIGGECAEMWSLIDLLDWVRMDVRTTSMGECCSAGACLAACGTHGKRVIAPNTEIMIHGAWDVMAGNKQQLAARQKSMEHEHNRDVKFWIRHSKYTTKKQIEEKFLNGIDQWITAEEALKHGIVDVMILNPPVESKPNKKSKG